MASNHVTVILDQWVFKVWKDAKNTNLQSILQLQTNDNLVEEDIIRATLACLCESGLLERKISTLSLQNQKVQFAFENFVSIIIVAYEGENG